MLPRSVSDIALNALRAFIGMMEFDSLLAERHKLNQLIAKQLGGTGQKWGIVFTRVEIQEIETTDETATAMRQQMEAERFRRATVAKAEGEAAKQIKIAEAARRASILRAEGEAQALESLAAAELNYLEKLGSALDREMAGKILLAQKMLESLERISANPAHKVFLPNDLRQFLLLDQAGPQQPNGQASALVGQTERSAGAPIDGSTVAG